MSVLLSGGIDSSLITGLLAETGTPDLRTCVFGFEIDLLFPFTARCHACAYKPLHDPSLTNLFLKSLEPNHEPARMQTLKIDPLYLKTTHGYARKRLSVPVHLARSETPLPHAAEPAQRRRDDDAA
ncbi:asparagine synthase C-terminal domain-containing protein [Cupriavidus basilensis]|nr:asparagine synthase C-terminal domain-containing protein [Cupriavidus basilensis]